MAADTRKEKAPLSNKGANQSQNPTKKKARYSAIIDWFRYTYKHDPSLPIADSLRIAMPRDPAFSLTGEILQNAKGYDSAQALTIGVIHWHSKLASQGISVELSGSALAEMRARGVSETFLLEHVANLLARVSTMDAAIDIYDSGGSQKDFIRARDSGTLATKARHVGEFAGAQKVKGIWIPDGTVYVGSPKGKVGMTIYDKAREQGLVGVDWIRIEMNWRGKHAQAVHHAMLKYGIAPTLRKAIASFASIPNRWFQQAMGDEIAVIEPVRRPETNTSDWLIKFIAPILERELSQESAKDGDKLIKTYEDIIIHAKRKRAKQKPL